MRFFVETIDESFDSWWHRSVIEVEEEMDDVDTYRMINQPQVRLSKLFTRQIWTEEID